MHTPDLSHVTWRKSSHSNGMGGSCVEIALLNGIPGALDDVAVRDSKDPHGPALTFTADQWHCFTAAITAHEFDLI